MSPYRNTYVTIITYMYSLSFTQKQILCHDIDDNVIDALPININYIITLVNLKALEVTYNALVLAFFTPEQVKSQ